jgi:hypothetical protein
MITPDLEKVPGTTEKYVLCLQQQQQSFSDASVCDRVLLQQMILYPVPMMEFAMTVVSKEANNRNVSVPSDSRRFF